MTDRLGWAVKKAEPYIQAALQSHGYIVSPYGQGLLTEQARSILRNVPTPQRWTPDYVVERSPIVDRPRWPEDRRGKYSFLVDAKYRWPGQQNYSIEMRSLIAGSTFGMDVYYVCGTRDGDRCSDIGVVRHDHVIGGWGTRPCCGECWQIFTQSADPMRELPDYCTGQKKTSKASGTPFIVFPPNKLDPLSDFVFDNWVMAKFANR